jgi:hypothetical protein
MAVWANLLASMAARLAAPPPPTTKTSVVTISYMVHTPLFFDKPQISAETPLNKIPNFNPKKNPEDSLFLLQRHHFMR